MTTADACLSCGLPLLGNETFCSNCGSRIVLDVRALASTMPKRPSRRFERRFYLAFCGGFLALVLWTFARTFYLKAFFKTPPLSLLLHIHGAVMSGWVVLLAVQSALIAARRVRWHRKLGVFGAVWAGLLVIFGTTTTIHAAVREVRGRTAFARSQILITSLDLVQMLLFAGFVIVAIRLRRRTDYHKRLMVLTIACMLPDALARLPVSFMTNRLILWGLDAFVLLCVGVDSLGHRRLHPAFAWGALLVLGLFHAGLHWFRHPGWIAFASRLLS